MTESISVRQQTQEQIIEYIQRHSSDGKLTRSLMTIAQQIGYSNATVHRAMKKLEAIGMIKIIPSDKPTEPNTIVYLGPATTKPSEATTQGTKLVRELQELSQEMFGYFENLSKRMKQYETDLQTYYELQSRLVDVVNLPDDKYQVMILMKSDKVLE